MLPIISSAKDAKSLLTQREVPDAVIHLKYIKKVLKQLVIYSCLQKNNPVSSGCFLSQNKFKGTAMRFFNLDGIEEDIQDPNPRTDEEKTTEHKYLNEGIDDVF